MILSFSFISKEVPTTSVSLASSKTFQSANMLDQVPAELIVDIVSKAQFDAQLIAGLLLTNKPLHALVKYYERSIVKEITTAQFPRGDVHFPGLASHISENSTDERTLSYSWLAEVNRRYDLISYFRSYVNRLDCGDICLGVCCLRWRNMFGSGMLVLYRIHDLGYGTTPWCIRQASTLTSPTCRQL